MAEKTPIPVGKYHTLKNGLRIHYHEVGTQRPDRPTVFFLHGGGPGASGYSNFKGNFNFLAEHGYHCIAPDLLGFGLSDKPADLYYHSVTHVAMMKDMVKALGLKSIVPVGNSLGGGVALHYTMTYPEDVAKLILMAPGGICDPRTFVQNMPGLVAMYKYVSNRPDDEESFRKLVSLLVYDPEDVTDEVINERFPIAMAQPAKLFETSQTPYYLANQLQEIEVPILGLWGKHDKFLPWEQSQVLKAAVPSARIVLSDRCGHWFMIEERDLFNKECLAFLDGR